MESIQGNLRDDKDNKRLHVVRSMEAIARMARNL